MSAPTVTDPTFVILQGVGEAIEEVRYLRDAIAAWEDPSELIDRCVMLQRRLRAVEQLGLDVRVAPNPLQGRLL